MDSQELKSTVLRCGKVKKIINILGRTMYIKLLSVYEMMLCEKLAKNLVIDLINQGFDRTHARAVSDNVCLCMMCLVNENNGQIFTDPMSLMQDFHADELAAVALEYKLLRESMMGFDVLNSTTLEGLKKNSALHLND